METGLRKTLSRNIRLGKDATLSLLYVMTIVFQTFRVQDMIALYGKHESMLNELKFRFRVSA